MREGSGGESTVDHGWDLPDGVREGLDELSRGEKSDKDKEAGPNGVEQMGPFISKRLGIADCELSFNTPNLRLISDLVESHLSQSTPPKTSSLDLVSRFHLFLGWPTCPSFRPRLHV